MSLDDTLIQDYFGFSPMIKGEVGVEIEIESDYPLPTQDFLVSHWRRTHDGSLRGEHTAEYIFKNPKTEVEAYRAIDYLSKRLPDINDSVRAGVHVHINVRDLTFLQVWTIVSCYYILENLLTNWCGEGRQGNHFCLRASDAHMVLQMVTKAIRRDNPSALDTDSIRYAALNFNALSKFGSLEFRQLRTPQDFDKIKTWISILLNIKRSSFLFPNPRAVVENFSLGGEEEFLRVMLREHVGLFEPNEDRLWVLRRGVRVAQEIAYAKRW